ncbi:MAG: ribonuclease P protein component [Patescibacteria group bacterium]
MITKRYKLPIQLFVGKKSGKIIRSPLFNLKIFSGNLPYSRFGVIISNKVSKKAVKRNYLKRQSFNFFQVVKNKLPIADYLIIFSPNAANIDKRQLQSSLSALANQLTN